MEKEKVNDIIEKLKNTVSEYIKKVDDKLNEYFSPNGKKMFLGLVAFAILAIVLLITSFGGEKKDIANDIPEDDFIAQNNINMNMNNVAPEVEIKGLDPSEEQVVYFTVEATGRQHPFQPYYESSSDIRKYGFDIVSPPDTLPSEDNEAAKVMQTKVSGIMYDSKRPSAILKIEDNDYLVSAGDYINSYKVLSISKDLVTVKLGKNTYKAGVGEILPDGEINENNVYNLKNKFGGSKRR